MGTALQFIFHPVNKLIWSLIDWHISGKADEIIKDMHMKIHENLIYKMTDNLFEKLLDGMKKATDAPLVELEDQLN